MESNEIFGSTAKADAVKAETGKSAKGTKKTAKKAAKKTTAKSTAKAAAPVKKEEAKTAEVNAVDAKAAAPKAAKAEKKSSKKAEADKPKRAYNKKPKNAMYIQFQGQQIDYDSIVKKVEEDCARQNVKAKDITLYVKPEDNACYYVANDGIAGKVDLY